MGRRIDPNLRDVLDSLSVKDGVRHPTQDLETLRTIVDRLRPGDQRARDLAPEAGAPAPEEDLEGLHETAEEPLPDEEDAEAQDDLGGLSFDTGPFDEEATPLPEEEQAVRFERVDATPPPAHDIDPYADTPEGSWADEDEEIMDFEAIGPREEDLTTGTTPADPWADEDATLAEATELDAALREAEAATRPEAAAETAPAPPVIDTFDLDAETADDLAELERQLADLERDLESLGAVHQDEEAPFARKRRDSDDA